MSIAGGIDIAAALMGIVLLTLRGSRLVFARRVRETPRAKGRIR